MALSEEKIGCPLATMMSALELTAQGPFRTWLPDLVPFTLYALGTFC